MSFMLLFETRESFDRLASDHGLLLDEIVSIVEPISEADQLAVRGIFSVVLQNRVLSHRWEQPDLGTVCLCPLGDPGGFPTTEICIIFEDRAIGQISPGQLARFDQDVAETFDGM